MVFHAAHLQRGYVQGDQVEAYVLRERARIGANVRSLREWRNLRQEGLAHLAGVSWRNLQRIEGGSTNVGLEAYLRVAHTLKVPLSSLLADDWSTPSIGDRLPGEPATPRATPTPPDRQGWT